MDPRTAPRVSPQELTSPAQQQSAPVLPLSSAQNIVKTPQVRTPDSALRHISQGGEEASYFPLGDVGAGTPKPTDPLPKPDVAGIEETAKSLEIPDDITRLALSVSPLKTEPLSPTETSPSFPVIGVAPGAGRSTRNQETWDRTLSRVINGIVSIKATTTRPFDTESAGDYTATGFVISKEHGLILSNRHVVSPAPIVSVAVFINYEEVPIWPVYRDPVHDFGVFRYDPAKLKHIRVEEIELRPDAAHVGEDIKVVGNDAGEKLSILGSTLARLDRHAPSYGIDSYNDFNTFYMQAASGTSGGSSGSPVLNIHGQAVALNAGGSNSSQSSFYLPLHRVVRAVEKIKNHQHVSRGTLQAEFLHKSYDELRRLGMTESIEEQCRAKYPTDTGLLSVVQVIRGGPASAHQQNAAELPESASGAVRAPGLEPGDILFSCNSRHISNFVDLWDIIDESVDQEITLEIFRAGKNSGAGGMMGVVCIVQDLHSITPSRFLEIGGAVFHDMSYQVGRSHNTELGTGVFCAGSGFLLWSSWSRDFLVTSAAGRPTRTLDEFIEVIRGVPDQERIPVMTRPLGKSDEHIMMVDIDRHFFLAALFERDDSSGTWIRTELDPAPKKEGDTNPLPISPAAECEEREDDDESIALDRIKSAMVNVVCRLPYSIFGHTSASNYTGVGLIVAVDPIPLVAFDRTAVPTEMLDVRLTVSNKSFPGKVVYLGHFALVTFDRHLLPEGVTVPVWDTVPLKARDEVKVIGLTSDQLLVQKDTTICSIGMNFNTKPCNPPRYRLTNVENINVLEAPSCWGGVIARKTFKSSDDFKVSAFYMAVSSQNRSGEDCCWTQGIDINRYILPIVSRTSQCPQGFPVEPSSRDLAIEFADLPLSTVSTMGLSEHRFNNFVIAAKKFRGNPRPLIVEAYLRPPPQGTNEESMLKIADIVLEIEGRPIYRVGELTELNIDSKSMVEVVVLRGRQEIKLSVPTYTSWPSSSGCIIQLFGAILHSTHSAALEQVAPTASLVPLDSPGVYVGGVSYGSPALDNIRPTHWILEIDGTRVSSTNDVLLLVKEKRWKQGEYVRVKQASRKGIPSLASVKVDERFWPTLCWTREIESGEWTQERWSGEEFVQPWKS